MCIIKRKKEKKLRKSFSFFPNTKFKLLHGNRLVILTWNILPLNSKTMCQLCQLCIVIILAIPQKQDVSKVVIPCWAWKPRPHSSPFSFSSQKLSSCCWYCIHANKYIQEGTIITFRYAWTSSHHFLSKESKLTVLVLRNTFLHYCLTSWFVVVLTTHHFGVL